MNKTYYNLEKLKEFRHEMHKYPEIGFQTFETSKRIKNFLLNELEFDEKDIVVGGRSGLVATMIGKAEPAGKNQTIMLRTDIDALPLKEGNPDLPYRSTNDAAHMCGHDGHTTCLLGFIQKYKEIIHTIPSNKIIKLLFQPNEEGSTNPSGAEVIIQEKFLEGVDEIYGYHNLPEYEIGKILIKSGPVMFSSLQTHMKITGKGAHIAKADKAINPIIPLAELILKIKEIKQKYIDLNYNFVFEFPFIETSKSFNIIPETVSMKGSIRVLDLKFRQTLLSELTECGKEICEKYQCQFEINTLDGALPVFNNEQCTQNVRKTALKVFGQANISGESELPFKIAEDFSFYTHKIPSCFFFVTSGFDASGKMQLHSPNYNFNDNIIEKVIEMYYDLVLTRFSE